MSNILVENDVSRSKDDNKTFETQNDGIASCFGAGDLVHVAEHAWPGVNNPEGIAKVLRAYIDCDGDQVYDICYIVGGKKKGVLPEYLSRHDFA